MALATITETIFVINLKMTPEGDTEIMEMNQM